MKNSPEGDHHDRPKLERHLWSLTLLLGLGVFMALPFVLQSGAVFFLPLTGAFVVAVILAPLADRLVRIGLPNGPATLVALLLFIALSVLVVVAIMQPAIALFTRLPELGDKASDMLQGLAASLGPLGEKLHLERLTQDATTAAAGTTILATVAVNTPGALLEFGVTLLLAYFFLRARVDIKRTLLLERESVSASLTAARTVREVQDKVSHYVGTVAIINLGVGMLVAFGTWAFGLANPIMWGGLAAILNFIPYLGPMAIALLLGITGLVELGSIGLGLLPALTYLGLHAVEANAITPAIIGQRLVMSPAGLLIGLTYFSWVWGTAGAILAIPLTIIIGVVLGRIGRPNVLGFIFGEPLFVTHPAGSD